MKWNQQSKPRGRAFSFREATLLRNVTERAEVCLREETDHQRGSGGGEQLTLLTSHLCVCVCVSPESFAQSSLVFSSCWTVFRGDSEKLLIIIIIIIMGWIWRVRRMVMKSVVTGTHGWVSIKKGSLVIYPVTAKLVRVRSSSSSVVFRRCDFKPQRFLALNYRSPLALYVQRGGSPESSAGGRRVGIDRRGESRCPTVTGWNYRSCCGTEIKASLMCTNS